MQQDILLENKLLSDINPLICGYQKCKPSHSFGPAVRKYYLLHYVFSGKGCFYSHDKIYNLKKGNIFVIRPDENTTYTADADDPWHYSWIGFESNLDLSGILAQDVISGNEYAHIFQALISCDRMESGRELYICSKIYELLAHCDQKNQPTQNRAKQYVRMAENYIQMNYIKEMKVERIARYLNLDRSYFSKIFKQHTGKSPQRYIVDFRIQKAAELISAHGLKPSEAAHQVGYTDIVNFSRMFQRKIGIAPSFYTTGHLKTGLLDPH